MQADLGVPVWRKTSTFVDGCGAVLFSDNDVSHGASCVAEPGIWHPTSPADLAAMRERVIIATTVVTGCCSDSEGALGDCGWCIAKGPETCECVRVAEANLAALGFGSSAT